MLLRLANLIVAKKKNFLSVFVLRNILWLYELYLRYFAVGETFLIKTYFEFNMRYKREEVVIECTDMKIFLYLVFLVYANDAPKKSDFKSLLIRRFVKRAQSSSCLVGDLDHYVNKYSEFTMLFPFFKFKVEKNHRNHRIRNE